MNNSPIRPDYAMAPHKADLLVKLAIGLWLGMALVLTILVATRLPERQSVYPGFAKAAMSWLHGEDIYVPSAHGYRYAPIVAPLLAPLAVMPDRLGGVLWRWANGLVLFGGLIAVCRSAIPFKWVKPACTILFLLVLPDTIANLNTGQPNAMVIGFMLLAVAGVVHRRWTPAAFCLAAATLLKLYPVALAGILILLYPRQLAWRYALFILAGLAVPFMMQRPDYVYHQYDLWYRYIFQENRQDVPVEVWYRDIRLPLKVWFNAEISNYAYRIIEAACGLAMAVVCWMLQRRKLDERRLLGIVVGWAVVWMTLIGPATETLTYLILIPSLSWALIEVWGVRFGAAATGSPSQVASPLVSLSDTQHTLLRVLVSSAYLLLLSIHVSSWFGGRAYKTLGPGPLAAGLYGIYLLLITVFLLRKGASESPEAGKKLA